MRGEAVTQRVRVHDLLESGPLGGSFAGMVDRLGSDGTITGVSMPENCVGQQQRVWVKFPRLLEEFSQALFVLKLQSHPVVFEPKLLCKTSDRVADLSVL